MQEYGGVDASEGKHADVVVAPVVLQQAVQLAVCRKWKLYRHTHTHKHTCTHTHSCKAALHALILDSHNGLLVLSYVVLVCKQGEK